jgi:hypothetical protein
VVVPPFGVE